LPTDISSRVEVNPIEILRDGPSYTIDTVEALAQSYPDDSLHLIIGSDAYAKLDQWHRIDDLKKLVTFIIIERPGSESDLGIDIGALNVASTGIREGSSREYSPSVAQFIKEHHLYGS
jgi:nicotinate-nucleotide adenylyltransferase